MEVTFNNVKTLSIFYYILTSTSLLFATITSANINAPASSGNSSPATSAENPNNNVVVFFNVGVYGDTVAHIIWENVDQVNITQVALESSTDGANFTTLSSAMVSTLPDIHANHYPQGINRFNNILTSTEHGNLRFLYNDYSTNQKFSTNPKWYRVKMISSTGDIYFSQINGTSPDAQKISNTLFSEEHSNHQTLDGGPKAGCQPIGTPTAGYTATTTTQTHYGQCCYWIETLYTAAGPVQTNCGGNSYAWCCSNVPEAPGCPSGYASDPCCVHYCSDYALCTCQPWQCCTSNLVSEWVVTQSADYTPISLSANVQDETCLGMDNGSISITVNNGTGPFIYAWSNGGNTSTITGLGNGTFTVTVTDAHNCMDTASYLVNSGQGITAFAGPNQSICPGDYATLTASGGATYQWSNGYYGSAITVNPNVTTIYTVTVTSSIGCTAIATATVTLYPQPVVSIVSSVQTFCLGSTDMLISNCNIAGTGFVWDDGSTSNARIVSPTVTTIYSVTGTSPDGCVGTSIFTLNVIPNPVLNLYPVNAFICYGSSTNISVTSSSAGTTYLWNTGGNGSTITVSPLTSTTYSVTGTSPEGCTSSTTVLITVLPLPIANAGVNQTICLGNSAVLTATGGYSYLWDNGGNTSSIMVNPTTSSLYRVTVTDINGCQATDDVNVNVNPLPVADAGSPQIICSGQTANLTAFGGVLYHWSNGLSSQSVNVSPTTSTYFIVTVTDVNGCSATDDVLVTVNQLPVAEAGMNQSVCFGSSVLLTASGGNSYQWNNGAGNTQVVVVSPPTTTVYIVTVTDQNGCSASDNVMVTVNPLPVANAGTDQSICIGTSTTLTASGGNSYQWSNGFNTQMVNITPLITTNYTVTVTNQNGCTATDNVLITVNPLPVANAGNDHTICAGTTLNIMATGGLYYNWSNGLGSSQTVTVNPTNTTTYNVIVTDANGCTASDAVTINVNQLPIANAGPDQTICNGLSATLSATGGISYQWSNGFITPTITVYPAITTSYMVVVTDNNGCSSMDQVIVNVNPNPHLLTTPESGGVCIGSSIPLTASGASTYYWSPSTGLSSTTGSPVFASPTSDITYVVVGTDANGCTTSASISITVHPLPSSSFTADNFEACQNMPIQFTNNSSSDVIHYAWNFSDPMSGGNNTSTIENPSHTFDHAGIFNITLVVTNNFGCNSSFTFPDMITIHPRPIADFNMTSNVVTLDNPVIYFYDASANATEWLWNFGDPAASALNIATTQSASHKFTAEGNYTVELRVKNVFGCTDSVKKEITKDHDFTFYIPNAFTPNGDGHNDGFIPVGTGYDPNRFEMYIYDRWGGLIYETHDINKPWKGDKKDNDKTSPIGVYVYLVYVNEMNGVKHKYTGTVTIAM